MYNTGPTTEIASKNLLQSLDKLCPKEDNKYKLDGIVVSSPLLESFGGLSHLLENDLLPLTTPVVANSDLDLKSQPLDDNLIKLWSSLSCMSQQCVGLPGEATFLKLHFCDNNPGRCFETRPQQIVSNDKGSTDEREVTKERDSLQQGTILLQVHHGNACPSVLLTADAPGCRLSWLFPPNDLVPLSIFQVPHNISEPSLPRIVIQSLLNEEDIFRASRILALYNKKDNFQELLEGNHELKSRFISVHGSILESLENALSSPPRSVANTSALSTILRECDQLISCIEQELTDDVIALITKEQTSELQKLYFIRSTLVWAHFYFHIEADLFLLPTIDRQDSLRLELICGICIGCKWRGASCHIALTSNRGLQKCQVLPTIVYKVISTSDIKIWCTRFTKPEITPPFFTIDPWCDEETPESNDNVILVNPSLHKVEAGKSFVLLNLRDFLPPVAVQKKALTTKKMDGVGKSTVSELPRDIVLPEAVRKKAFPAKKADILATGTANAELPKLEEKSSFHISSSALPVCTSSKQQLTTSTTPTTLDNFLQSIGYCDDIAGNLSDLSLDLVLSCLSNTLVVLRLVDRLDREESTLAKLLSAALMWKVNPDTSTFVLTATKTTAISADIELVVPKETVFQGKILHAACLTIGGARTYEMLASIKLEFSGEADRLEIPNDFLLDGSRGQTLADYLHSNNRPSWEQATQFTVEETFNLLCGEKKASQLIEAFPKFLISYLVKWRIIHYLTTIDMGGPQRINEAHIYASQPLKTNLLSSKLGFDINVKKVGIHVQFKQESFSPRVELEGECSVGKNFQGHIMFNSNLQEVHVIFRCPSPQSLLDLVGAKYKESDLTLPEIGTMEGNFKCKAGFVLFLPKANVSAPSISMLTFAVRADKSILQRWLPSNTVSKVDNIEVFALIDSPFSENRKMGLRVQFTLTFPACTLKSVLNVIPPQPDASEYLYQLDLMPVFSSCASATGSSSIFQALSCFASEGTKHFTSEMSRIGDCLHGEIDIKKLTLTMSSNVAVKSADFEASISNLPLFSEKITVTQCKVKGHYEESGLTLECSGDLVLFKRFSTSTELTLPTRESDGEFHFRNSDNSLTLVTLMSGFEMLSSDFQNNPFLTNFLDISVTEVKLTLNKSDEGIQVTGVVVLLFKKDVDIALMKLHDIDLTITANRTKGSDSYRVEFDGKCIVGKGLHGHISFSSESEEVHVTFKCPSPQSLFDLVGANCKESDLTFPVIGKELKHCTEPEGDFKCEAGFVVSQPLGHFSAPEITMLTFAIKADENILQSFLPSNIVNKVDNIEVSALIDSPFSENRKMGLRVQFILTFPVCTLKSVLNVIPPQPDASEYLYQLDLMPVFSAHSSTADSSSVFEVLSSFDSNDLKNLSSEMSFNGDYFLKAITVEKLTLTLSSNVTVAVKSADFEASISNLPLFSEKITVTQCKVKGHYDESGLTLECSGDLVLFKRFSTSTELTLPTTETDGEFHFRNSDNSLTLVTLMSGFEMLSSDFQNNPFLTNFLDISVTEVKLTLNKSDDGIQVTGVVVSLFKKDVDIALMKLHDIDLTITANRTKGSDPYRVEFDGKCIVGKGLHGHISFSSESEEVHVTFKCPSPQSLFDLVGANCKESDLTFPVIGKELKHCTEPEGDFKCEAGFVVSQPLGHFSAPEITMLTFAIKADENILQSFLPSNIVSKVDNIEAFARIDSPFSENRKMGLRVQFILTFPVCTLKSVLNVIPPQPDASEYLYQLDLMPVFSAHSSTADSSSVLEVLSSFDSDDLKNLSSEMSFNGDYFLKAITVEKLTLTLSSNVTVAVKSADFEASISNLPLFSEKITVTQCKVKGHYEENVLTLECSGDLVLFKRFSTSTELTLPTRESDGKFQFQNFERSLTLETLLTGFDLFSAQLQRSAILSNFLDISVKEVTVSLGNSDYGFQVTGAVVSLYKKELDISVVKLNEIELTTSLTRAETRFDFHFQAKAYIGEFLYTQVVFDSKSHTLSGSVQVTPFGGLSAPEALKAFNIEAVGPSVHNFEDLTIVLQNHFMKLFASGANDQKLPGMTGSLTFTVSVPSKVFGKYTLDHLSLQVKDLMSIRNFALKSFVFEYSKQPFDKATHSRIRLTATLSKLTTNECSIVEFNLASKRNESSVLTAQLHAGPDGGLIKLSSIIEFAGCGKPALPDIEIPAIFDIELLNGSKISFVSSPFKVQAIDVKVHVSEWKVFGDPKLTVHDLEFRLQWNEGHSSELTFTGHLTFVNLFLSLNGVISANEILVHCKQVPHGAIPQNLEFQRALSEYTENSSQNFEVPQHIGLPPVVVNLKDLKLHLQKQSKLFRFNGQLLARDPWQIIFGSKAISVTSIGAVLEWEKKLNTGVQYRAYVYGTMNLLDLQVDVQMQLGKGVDCIIAGMMHKPDYESLAGYLSCSSEDYSESDAGSSFSELVPSGMNKVSGLEAAAALNITKKQFFISGHVHHFGSASLFVGQLPSETKMNYMLHLSLRQGFKFSMLSEQLSFIDEAVSVHNAHLLVSTFKACTLSEILEPYRQAFTQLTSNHRPLQPLDSLPGLLSNKKLMNSEIKKGTTLYAEIDTPACKRSGSLLYNVFRIGREGTIGPDIIVTASVTKVASQDSGKSTSDTRLVPCSQNYSSASSKQFELKAWISEITLVGLIKFSDIELLFQLPQQNLSLSGEVLIDFSYGKLHFLGDLQITPLEAKFEASPASPYKDVISKPAGFNVIVRDLQLQLKFDLSPDTVNAPMIMVSGEIDFSSTVILRAFVLLHGLSFKVFHISLARGLSLSLLFEKSNIAWSVTGLKIDIESGEFYYAAKTLAHHGTTYEEGFHMKAVIGFLNSKFRVGASVSHDRKNLRIWGQSVSKIDLVFGKLTSDDFEYGPMLEYSSEDSKARVTLRGGVELLGWKMLRGSISYLPQSKAFEGEISYPGSILWFHNPTLKVSWSEAEGFQIVDFSVNGGTQFNLLRALQTFAKVIYNLVTGILRWNMKFNIRTVKNNNPSKYLVKFILSGSIGITVLGYLDIDCIPLPEIPLNILRCEDFSFSKLPGYLLRCLWDSAWEICKSLWNYLNPWELAKKMGKMIIDSIKGAVTKIVDLGAKVVEGVKTAGKAIGRFFKGLFGGSAFILDGDNNVVGYIYAGKDGRPLRNEEFIVEHFGPFLVVSGIGEMAMDITTNGKACIDVPEDVKDNELTQKVNQDSLGELKTKSKQVAEELRNAAQSVLTVSDIELEITTQGEQKNQLQISWKVTTSDGRVEYSKDNGDIDHHVVVTATIVENTADVSKVPSIQTQTIFDEVLTRSEDLTSLWPYCEVDIDTDILQTAICIGVNIHPSVTMRVKAIPSNEPFHVEQEWIDTKDNQWMGQAKERIEKEGREKEVTLHGRTWYKELMTKPFNTSDGEMKVNAKCEYRELEISGSIVAKYHPLWYIVEIVDASHRTTVLARQLFQSSCSTQDIHQVPYDAMEESDSVPENTCPISNDAVEETHSIDPDLFVNFSITLPDLSDPTQTMLPNSDGPYVVTCIGLNEDFTTTSRFELSQEELLLTRHSPPMTLTQIYPKANDSCVDDTVKVTWALSESDTSEMGEYKFLLIGSQPLTMDEAVESTDSIDSEMSNIKLLKDFVCPSQDNPEESPYCCYEFSLNEVLKKKRSNIDLSKPLILICSVCTAGDSKKLPSLFTRGAEVTIIASPANIVCSLAESEGGLMVSWPYSTDALSYRLEFVDNSSGKVVLPRPNDYHYKKTSKSKVEGCDVDQCIFRNGLEHLSYNGAGGYSLQIHALGFGDEILRSPFPTQAKEIIHVLPVDIKYVPQNDTILVNFKLHNYYKTTNYYVELYQCSENKKSKLGEVVVHPPCSQVVFTRNQWESNFNSAWPMSRSYTISGWVAANVPIVSERDEKICLPFGVSSNELVLLPSPNELSIKASYNSQLAVQNWLLKWTEVDFTLKYEYGLCTPSDGEIILSKTTLENAATIVASSLKMIPVTVSPCIVSCTCFLRCTTGKNKHTIPSYKLLGQDIFYVVSSSSSSFNLLVIPSLSLSKLWTFSLTTAILRPSALNLSPRKSKYIVLPSGVLFPDFPHEVVSNFWHPGCQLPRSKNVKGEDKEKYIVSCTKPESGEFLVLLKLKSL